MPVESIEKQWAQLPGAIRDLAHIGSIHIHAMLFMEIELN